MSEETALWERQWWDTNASFHAFSVYYFPQQPQRSVDKAYRRAKPKNLKGNKRDTRKAARVWRQWAQGRTNKGDKVKGGKTWQERMAAWDSKIARDIAKQEQEKKERQVQNWKTLADAAFGKLIQQWTIYQPSPNVKISELTLATSRLYELMTEVYGMGEIPTLNGHAPHNGKLSRIAEDIGEEDNSPPLTTGEKLAAVARIFAEAEEREQAQDKHGETSP